MAVQLPERLSAPRSVVSTLGVAPPAGPRSDLPRMNSGLGIAAEPTQLESPSSRPAETDGRFTVGEAGRNLLRGMANVVVETWQDLKTHPIRTIALFVGMAVLSTLLPIVGSAIMVLELGKAAFQIGTGLLKTVGLLRADQPDDAERALAGVGQGLGEIGLVALEGWLEKVIDVNRAIPKTVVAAFRRLRNFIGGLFGKGPEGDDDPD